MKAKMRKSTGRTRSECFMLSTSSVKDVSTNLLKSLQTLKQVSTLSSAFTQGRRPRGDWGDGPPQNLRWGDGPCIRPPNISRSSVVGCAQKYEKSKKSVIKEFFSEILVFLVGKGKEG